MEIENNHASLSLKPEEIDKLLVHHVHDSIQMDLIRDLIKCFDNIQKMETSKVIDRLRLVNWFIINDPTVEDSKLETLMDLLQCLEGFDSYSKYFQQHEIILLIEFINNVFSVLVQCWVDDCTQCFLDTYIDLINNEPNKELNAEYQLALKLISTACSAKSDNDDIEWFSLTDFPQLGDSIIKDLFKIPQSVLKSNVDIFKQIMKIMKNNNLLCNLWNQIKDSFDDQNIRENNEKFLRLLTILYYLGDHFIVLETTDSSLSLKSEKSFWKMLQTGISNQDAMVRKLSLYLTKRYLCDFENAASFETDLFKWRIENKIEILDSFATLFILCEVLEESQIHIITPAFKELQRLISYCTTKKILHPTWLSSVFIRLFNQDSVVVLKQAINLFTSMNTDWLHSDYNYKQLLYNFFKSLNNLSIFYNVSIDSEGIQISFQKWLNTFTYKPSFYCDVLEILSTISWNPISLFYVVNALSNIHKLPSWGNNELIILKKFIVEALRTQTIIIRGAIQSGFIKCLINLTKQDVAVLRIADIVGVFRKEESLKRGTNDWSEVCEWLTTMLNENQVEMFLNELLECKEEKMLTPQSIARFLNLVSDSKLLPKAGSDHFLQVIFAPLDNAEKRLYNSVDEQNYSIKVIFHTLKESENFGSQEYNNVLIEIIDKFPEILQFLKYKFKTVVHLSELNIVELYIDLLATIYKYDNTQKKCFYLLQDLFDSTINELYIYGDHLLPLKEFISLKIVHLHCTYYPSVLRIGNMNFSNIFKEKILHKSLLNEQSSTESPDDKRLRGLIISSNIQTVWNSFDNLLSVTNDDQITNIFEQFPLDSLMTEALEVLNTGGKEAVVIVLNVFDKILKFYEDSERISHFINTTWKMTFELRKSELFWKSMAKWISMVFHEEMLKSHHLLPLIRNYAAEILIQGNEVSGLANLLVRHLNTFETVEAISHLDKLIVDCLLFGPLIRRDQKLEIETCNHIHSMKDAYPINSLVPQISTKCEKEVRLTALNLLLKCNKEEDYNLIVHVVNQLIKEDRNSGKNNKRYFNDSIVHRCKNRMLQVLFVLFPFIAENQNLETYNLQNLIYEWAVESLLGESQQPSIRYQLEWLYCILCLKFPDIKSKFWETFDKALNERIGSVSSFICVAYHLAKSDINDNFFESFIEHILPCCMSQNFMLRLYSQVTLEKLWPYYITLSEKYELIRKNQKKVISQGNMLANAQKLQHDFYFVTFDVIKHFDLQTIFWDLPRLSNLSSEEWISISMFEQYVDINMIGIPVMNEYGKDMNLRSYSTPSWITKADESSTQKDETTGIQKKFIPWRGMFPSDDETPEKRTTGGLILVTSLIDKPANLGGLARSCDVFGVKELVLGSLEYAKDKGFSSLSMTAEKHLSIVEVKPHNLCSYLGNLKENGYTIVGAEQTTNSVTLSEYNFPFKTVVVLGNEREGIPADILLHLDACVEIPQFGVIRSLNVHVTGAILLWEYCKQHLAARSS